MRNYVIGIGLKLNYQQIYRQEIAEQKHTDRPKNGAIFFTNWKSRCLFQAADAGRWISNEIKWMKTKLSKKS